MPTYWMTRIDMVVLLVVGAPAVACDQECARTMNLGFRLSRPHRG